MRLQGGHLHAVTAYEAISYKHFLFLISGIIEAKIRKSKSLTCHIPLELQHPQEFKNKKMALRCIRYGEFLKRFFKVKLYWENAPLLNYKIWNLAYGPTDWSDIPDDIDICLDTGHLMLGCKTIQNARKEIWKVFTHRRKQIKHLHISENDFIHDLHKKPSIVITPQLLKKITTGRSYIFEK